HVSSATEVSWDTMDGNLSSWIGLSGTGWTSRLGQHEGSGMLGLNFSIPPGPPGWAGVQRSSPVNWSAYDRLVLWIEPTASSLPLSFNVTAYVGSNLYQTAPRDLVAGWQEIPVDLTAFGPVRDGDPPLLGSIGHRLASFPRGRLEHLFPRRPLQRQRRDPCRRGQHERVGRGSPRGRGVDPLPEPTERHVPVGSSPARSDF